MSKMVMSAISEDVKWREDREQIVRYADKRYRAKKKVVVVK